MILNTGNRTDIPTFFSEWFYNRINDGYVDVLNPYTHTKNKSYWRYEINPNVVDVITFTTKNPKPMLADSKKFDSLIKTYHTFWFMTITPYSNDIEQNVPDLTTSIDSFKELSKLVGVNAIGWRFDPILFGNGWDSAWIIKSFSDIALQLRGYTNRVTISFVNMYQKLSKNAPFITRPNDASQSFIVDELVKLAKLNDMELYVCHDKNPTFSQSGANMSGCASVGLIADALNLNLKPKLKANARNGCECALNADIGQYNTCMHKCLYCYANNDHKLAEQLYSKHDVMSSCLIGHVSNNDTITNVKQESWIVK